MVKSSGRIEDDQIRSTQKVHVRGDYNHWLFEIFKQISTNGKFLLYKSNLDPTVEVSVKSRLTKILSRLVERPQAFNKAMEKAEKTSGAKEDILWGYPEKNFKTKLPLA